VRMSSVISYEEFETKTGGPLDALDITDEVLEVTRSSGVTSGNVLVFSPHTTCSVFICEAGLESVRRLQRAMSKLAPADLYYQHDDLSIRTENMTEDEPANAPAHIFHVFAGKASECIPIVDGVLSLGVNQRVLFVELDCSRSRRYCIQVVGELA
jgi:secondary thiamine-phosphate synthase enzyme